MGQQQLLLVILVTILVGIATVVAMNVFGGAAEDANRDAVRQDIMQGATSAQAIHARPVMLDGAGGDFLQITDVDGTDSGDALLQRLGMPITMSTQTVDGVEVTDWGNENGTYEVTSVAADQFTLVGTPASGGEDIQATISVDANSNWDINWDPSQ